MAQKECLPLDVLEEIVDALAVMGPKGRHWYSAISSFSLVCQATLPMSRKHLFANVTVNRDYEETGHTTHSLYQLLTKSPELAPYIRTLIFTVVPSEVKTRLDMFKVFQNLTRLQSLQLRCDGRRCCWSYYRQMFLPLLHLPTIIKLELVSIAKFVPSDLLLCVGLNQLEIRNSTYTTDGSDGILFDMSQSTSSIAIEKFRVIICVLDLRSFKDLFSHCHRLIDIDIQCRGVSRLAGLFNIVRNSLKTLKNIRVESRIHDGPDSLRDPFSGLCEELEKIRGRNVLESLEICISAQTDFPYRRWNEWRALENTLNMNGFAFPALNRVSLAFTVFKGEDTPDTTWNLKQALSKHFQALASSPTVDFDLQVFYADEEGAWYENL